ncbi:MAG: hypothetical protein QG623_68 [Patescibacteria group bacterium]|nr:hypothetical protein [Patescibacteria group bacterium]
MSDKVNMNTRPNKSYSLLPYDAEWAVKYELMSKRLKLLFADNFVWIEHGGSTSVPGMLAKPQIDIYVAVKDLVLVKQMYDIMEKEGFKCWGDYIQKDEPEEYFTKDKDGNREFSVHVMQYGNANLDDTIIFRDYLRANEKARESYIKLKLKLMEKFSDQDYNSYGKGKIDFLEDLKAKARLWDKAGRPS